jgi:hypothetical protein
MVNNSTNINKTNNHLSPQIIEHKKKHKKKQNKTTAYNIVNCGLRQLQRCSDVKPVNDITNLHFWCVDLQRQLVFTKWVSACCLKRHLSNFSVISWREQVNFQRNDDEVCFVLDQYV